MKHIFFLSMVIACMAIACNNPSSERDKMTGNEMKMDTISCPPGSSKLDIPKIEQLAKGLRSALDHAGKKSG